MRPGLAWPYPRLLAGIVLCLLLQGAGMGLCWPAIVQRTVRCADPSEARGRSGTRHGAADRVAIGAAATGIAANFAGLAEGISPAAARAADSGCSPLSFRCWPSPCRPPGASRPNPDG